MQSDSLELLALYLLQESMRLDSLQQYAESAERLDLSPAASSAFAAGRVHQLQRDREALQAIFHNECDFYEV